MPPPGALPHVKSGPHPANAARNERAAACRRPSSPGVLSGSLPGHAHVPEPALESSGLVLVTVVVEN